MPAAESHFTEPNLIRKKQKIVLRYGKIQLLRLGDLKQSTMVADAVHVFQLGFVYLAGVLKEEFSTPKGQMPPVAEKTDISDHDGTDQQDGYHGIQKTLLDEKHFVDSARNISWSDRPSHSGIALIFQAEKNSVRPLCTSTESAPGAGA
jgi:hypothetical protein